jgi:hypothetical protein
LNFNNPKDSLGISFKGCPKLAMAIVLAIFESIVVSIFTSSTIEPTADLLYIFKDNKSFILVTPVLDDELLIIV